MIPEAEAWIGQSLSGGRYRISSKLGEGGMALVYGAHDRNLDCDVVVKVPRRAMLEEPEFAARFTREIRALVQLVHPNIVRVIDVGEEGGVPFSVMQYLSGGTLRDRRRLDAADKPVADRIMEVTSWLEPIAAALDFIHKQGYVHRDVKPENILFDQHGHAYLSDFGIAKIVAERSEARQRQTTCLTGAGMVVGTVAYMSPEMLLGQPYDGRADQFALAVTLFESLAGTFPFSAPTPAALLVQQTTQPPLRLDRLLPSLPPGMAAAVHRGLEADRHRRHPDCRTLANEVLAAAKGPSFQRMGQSAPVGAVPPSVQPDERIKVRCPGCNKGLKVHRAIAGKKVRCMRCRKTFWIPLELAPSLAATPEASVVTAAPEPGVFGIPPTATAPPAQLLQDPAPPALLLQDPELPPIQLLEDLIPRRRSLFRALLFTVVVASPLAIALLGVVVGAKFMGHPQGKSEEQPKLTFSVPGPDERSGGQPAGREDDQRPSTGTDRVWPALPKNVQDWNKKRPGSSSERAERPRGSTSRSTRRQGGALVAGRLPPQPDEPSPDAPPAPAMPPRKPALSEPPRPESDEAVRKAVTDFLLKRYRDNANAFEILKIEKPTLRKVRGNNWELTTVAYVRFRALGSGTNTGIFAVKGGEVIQACWSYNQTEMFGKPGEAP
jgi:serine/threonine protein kinase